MPNRRRILLKLSGEALAGEKDHGYDENVVRGVARQVKQAVDRKVQVAVVIGGGNFWRGRKGSGMADRTKADQIGMLATVMNAIYVSDLFRQEGMDTEIFTPFQLGAMTKLFSKDEAGRAMEAGQVVFFAGGTGHPYFSTDTGVALRAIEMEADEILLAKSIDAVYDKDPDRFPDAVKYESISIDEVVAKELQVIDMAASILCKENKMPLVVFGLNIENSIALAMEGRVREIGGTTVTV